MTWLLELAGRPGDNGVRPHSLKVTTSSTLMTEVAKGQANLSQLAIQGNYRSATSQDMAKVYSRDMGQTQIAVSKFEKKKPGG